ncbi:MAG TPA: SNF2-related protein [Methylomirabilota bacterium]|nr:SNF2-related protein [Methylomirabilota bacterium]
MKIAGWEAMKRARAYLGQEQVLSSDWTPPVLKGVVQAGGTAYRAGLVIKTERDIENLCTCRDAREWGTICAHSVAVGLHHLRGARLAPAAAPPRGTPAPAPVSSGKARRPGAALRRDPEQGEPAELHIILPPNFVQASAKGKVMLCLEVRWRQGRGPLDGLPRDVAFRFSAQDAALLDHIEHMADGETPALLWLEAGAFSAILRLLQDHPRVTLGRSEPVTINGTPWPANFRATLLADGQIELVATGRTDQRPAIVGGDWGWKDRTLRPLGLEAAWREVFERPVRLPREQVPRFLSVDWPRLQAAGGIEAGFRVEDFVLRPAAPEFSLELEGGLARLQALLRCRYGRRILTPGVTDPNEALWLPDPDSPTTYTCRDLAAEKAAVGRLARAGFTGPDAQGRWQLVGQDSVLNFFARDLPRWQREWKVSFEERLQQSTARNLERIEPRIEITSSGVQWFDLGVCYETTGGERFSAADIQRLLRSGRSHTRLSNGKVALLDTGAVEELQEVLRDCAPRQHEGGYRINGAQAGFLEATLREHGQWPVRAPAAWRERAARQSGEARLECPPLGPLEGVLRPYQKAGVAWLHFLRANEWGGILADEMGLGKTLQALAYLATIERAGPSLVVCPTSLVPNWAAEAARFAPGLRVVVWHGTDRHSLAQEARQCDVLVTSYALMRRDWERHRELEFDTVILDEAQHIKNRQSQNAQAVKAVRARHRFVLTGTPLENSVLDLWSIFDFLMPGYLGTAQDFRDRYEVPITRERNVEAQARLARRLKPFLLRRLKRDVAAELPEKIEQVAYCELTAEQRAAYRQLFEATRKEVLEAVGEQGLARSRMVVLSALLRLRQVCCDLRLLGGEGVDPDQASGKLDLLGELLDEVIDGGHRVLVFSQFVTMLRLIQERLAQAGIEHCYLDGSTEDRAGVVRRFQADAGIPVFLISLKAGGVGLNLTGADTVIHFDPWWNPAVEDQATDRAHRIGQARVVTSYKLIARDTIEEKILLLQQRKREIIRGTLATEEQWGESLTWEEIQSLLTA